MTTFENKTVREIALENPASVRVFESVGIDYCCGGRRPLAEACQIANVAVERVVDLIANSPKDRGLTEADWSRATQSELIDHIVGNHHTFVRQEAPRLEMLLDKVISHHGAAQPELHSIQQLFSALSQELTAHMMKEEQVLFPHLKRLEESSQSGSPCPSGCFGTVEMPISRMLADHDDAGELTAKIRALSGNFQPPEQACPSYRRLYQGLEEFERDLHQHVHLENNVLFPRAIEMERASGG